MSQANARHTYLLRIQSVKTELNKRENGRVISDVGKSDALASQKASSFACKTTSEEIKMKLLCHLDFDLVASTVPTSASCAGPRLSAKCEPRDDCHVPNKPYRWQHTMVVVPGTLP